MFQVFVDSAANLPAVTAKKYDIHVVSFVNLVNGKELVCFDPDLSPEEELAKGKEYYNAMRTGKLIPEIICFRKKFDQVSMHSNNDQKRQTYF